MGFSLKKLGQAIYHGLNTNDNGQGWTSRAPTPQQVQQYQQTTHFNPVNNSLTRGLSRAYDQANMWDNNRTWQHTTPTNTKSAFQQTGQLGGQFARSSATGLAQMANTFAAQVPQVYYSAAQQIAARTHNPVAYQNATRNVEAANSMFQRGKGGLLNVGTLYNADEARRGDLKTGIKRIGGGTAQAMTEAASMMYGGTSGKALLEQGVKKGLQTQAPNLAKNFVLNTAQGGITAYNNGANRGDILKNAALSGITGTAGDLALGIGGAYAGKGLSKAVNTVKNTPLNQGGYIKISNPGGAKTKKLQVNNPDGAKTTGLQVNNPMGANIKKPLKVNNPMGADTRAKINIKNNTGAPLAGEDIYGAAKQAFESARPPKDGAVTARMMLDYMKNPSRKVPDNSLTGQGAMAPTQLSAEAKQSLMAKARAKIASQEGSVGPRNSEQPTIKNVFGEDVPNPSYVPPKEQVASAIKAAREGKKTTQVSLNTDRLDLTPEQKIIAKADTTATIPRLTNKEVVELAQSAGIDTKKVGIAETRKQIAEQLNVRRKLVETHAQADAALKAGDLETRASLLQQAAELGRASTSQGTDIARQLQARKILADQLRTPEQKVFNLLDTAGVDPKVYTKRFADVDFKDANAVTKAYRELVPAKFEDWIDKFRYTNMLSSPLTHIVNATSNLQGSLVVAPVQKLYEGGVDAVRSALTGKARTRFAGEAGASLKGTISNIPQAIKAFGDVMSGKADVSNPDFAQSLKGSRLAVGGVKGTLDNVLEGIPKLLEAADQFTMKMTTGGETAALKYRAGKGVKVGDVLGTAEETAKYRAFRQELGKQGQGHLLDLVDAIPQMANKWRNSKNPYQRTLAKYTLPFVTTPTNLFKQGIEYSPLGILTLHGNADKTAQVAKMLMGTTVVSAVAGTAAANDALTFSEPSNAAERDAFRAEGKQPYAIKIGGKWIGYSKLHPAIAFNLALVAAVKDGLDKGTIDESGADKLMRIGGGMLGFLTDQSYMKSVGDAVNIFQGKDSTKPGNLVAGQATNTANQLMPFKSMVSWVGRMVDPTQRKTDYSASPLDQIYQGVIKDIPGLNNAVPARKNPYTGENLKNDNPVLNSFVPTRVTNDKGYGNTTGLNVDQRMAQKQMPEGDRKQFRADIMLQKGVENLSNNEKDKYKSQNQSGVKQLPNGKFFTKVGGEYKTFDSQDAADQAVFKNEFKNSDKKSAVRGDTYYYKNKKGDVVSKPKIQYDYEQVEAKTNLDMDRAMAKKDLKSWFDAADKQYAALEAKKQLFDPETEQDEIDKITLKQENLRQKADKYGQYGGFTKGRSTSSSSSSARLKVSVKGTVAKAIVKTRSPGKLQGSVKYATTSKPKVTIKKSMV